ncbi:MAG: TonB-dependent receptor [Deltaproteobacteria bacterium]|nr:TonB-dependent receptor [Deltaproteobacteria bacterium]
MRPGAAVTCGIAFAVAATAPARAGDDVEPFDADGDGDIDDDDLAILRAAERVEIVDKSDAQKLRESARAVTVIDTRRARERTADLGEVLSRAQGIQVRRSGGLGSTARLSLNGLYDDQIRFFLDGVPLDFAGWGLGIANVPVELVQRIEVHRGVVPIALGADALGGAVDLITDPSWVNRAAVSYQTGSFGTHRTTVTARARDGATGLALGLALFVDRAANDYPVDVEAPDAQGRLQPVRVRRFHDAYTAAGGSVEAGLAARGAVKRALVRLYASDYDKQLQHNAVMTVPYGEATYGETARGVTGDLELERGRWRGRLLAGAALRAIDFDDRAPFVYDWFGNQVRERRRAGELGGDPTYRRIRETGAFARLTAERALGEHQRVRATLAPTAVLRGGTDFLDPNPGGRDPLSARRDLLQVVTGVEHDVRALGDRLENIAFAKHYAMWTDAEDVRPGFLFVPVAQRTQRFGIGDGVRYRVTPRLAAKASYEWATRLPSVDEVFGDGILVHPNLALAPERSHNANAGFRLEAGGAIAEANLFARLADRMIVLLGDDRFFTYQNVFAARILGIEGTAGWVAPGEWLSVEGTATVQDLRNASSEGTFGAFEGDRIPNRPWLLGALGATIRRRDVARRGDELALFASSRYVHAFFRAWESSGLRELKQVVPSQLVHGAGITYAVRGATPVVTTIEVQNLTDARAFDAFGVQRPGRALFVKLSAEL